MTEEPQEGTPVSRLVEVLDVERHAKVGVLVGAAFALLGAALIASSPYRGGYGPKDLVLGFVIVVSTALLVTVLLTVRSVVRLTMSPPKWIRRGGTVAAVAGAGLATLGLLAPTAAAAGFESAYGRILPLLPIASLYGIWAVHAANRRRYGRFGAAGAVISAVGSVLLSWFAAIETGAYLGGTLQRVQPAVVQGVTLSPSTVFLGVNLVALAGATVLGLALLRSGTLPTRAALASTFVLPVGLLGVTAATVLGTPELVPMGLFVPLGIAWFATGYDLRHGRGVPPADWFETAIDAE